LASPNRQSTRGPSAGSDHSVGERKACAAPAAHEAPRAAIGARLVPVPFAPQEEDYLSAPASGERQTPRYPYPGYAHVTIPPVQSLRAAEPNGNRGVWARSSAFRLRVVEGQARLRSRLTDRTVEG
jgi:hypothetical protein